MGFVDDVDLALALGRGEVHLLPDVSYLVDPTVAGGVEFDDVHELAAVDRKADGAGVAGVSVQRLKTVDRLGDDSGGGGLAAAPWPAEQVGVGDAALFDRLAQCAGNVLLPHQLAEAGRPPLAVENLGGRSRIGYGLAGHFRRVSIKIRIAGLGFNVKCR